jgi:formylmethanofuran dehydrogenase subunit D
MESDEPKSRPKYEWKNVRIPGRTGSTGGPCFERKRVRVVDSSRTPEQPPDMDTLPPIGPNGEEVSLKND